MVQKQTEIIVDVYVSKHVIPMNSAKVCRERWYYAEIPKKYFADMGENERELAEELVKLSYKLKKKNNNLNVVRVNYNGYPREIIRYVDICLKRPKVASEIIGLRKLSIKERKNLRENIQKLERKNGLSNLIA